MPIGDTNPLISSTNGTPKFFDSRFSRNSSIPTISRFGRSEKWHPPMENFKRGPNSSKQSDSRLSILEPSFLIFAAGCLWANTVPIAHSEAAVERLGLHESSVGMRWVFWCILMYLGISKVNGWSWTCFFSLLDLAFNIRVICVVTSQTKPPLSIRNDKFGAWTTQDEISRPWMAAFPLAKWGPKICQPRNHAWNNLLNWYDESPISTLKLCKFCCKACDAKSLWQRGMVCCWWSCLQVLSIPMEIETHASISIPFYMHSQSYNHMHGMFSKTWATW